MVGTGDDPDALDVRPDAEIGAHTEARAAALFSGPPQSLQRLGTCLYTLTDDEDYILDLLPGDPRIAVGAGFSGHGFKLAPVTGRILAGLVLEGVSDVVPFEEDRERFAITTKA